jgi:hypothetical protein
MAKSKNNVITHGLSGKIGDLLVFRQKGGKTVVAKLPVQSQPASEKQKAQRRRFQQAVLYAKVSTASPETGEMYSLAAKKEKRLPLNIAVADFFHAPDIETVDLSVYTGAVGDTIRIIVTDDFAVKSVHVQISNADGSLVEEGEALQNAENLWIYTATKNNESLDGDKIVIAASDMPGNITREEWEL